MLSTLEEIQTEVEIERDVRLDACRGVALWFVFLDHIPNNIGSWLTLRYYGFSDTTEVFMFVSGVTCALAYGRIRLRDGWLAVISHTLRRSWEIYAAFLILTIACGVMVYLAGGSQFADETNTKFLLQDSGVALAHASILQYRPVNTDVLPTFVVFHLMFAPLLWLLVKIPDVTLGTSLLIYLLARSYGWNLAEWPSHAWYFNPFAWQLLVILGAWWAMRGRQKLGRYLTTPIATSLAASYLLFSLVVALSWSIKPLEALIPPLLAKLIYPIDKSGLDPLRLLHFVALAVVLSRFLRPDWRGLTAPVLRSAVRCGENSLEVYCVGVLLSLAGHMLLVKVSSGIAMQLIVSASGILFLVAFATVLTWIGIRSRQHPKLL
ncbi:MAG TPA: OpgC domain-containing protein [Bradyrhizobium sp.]|uniref:OpgC domain-containing protein n=1 Tax=Bradyrhizobium sp. TaxID=376 RepID=UPI002B62DE6E|nr:OpgC domain-containing protein [Bradyrhizobium sp.]HLZ01161.1 OpgC domain-containing protein [Bradyrhizobium sp.]